MCIPPLSKIYTIFICHLSLRKAGEGEEYLEADKSKFLWKTEVEIEQKVYPRKERKIYWERQFRRRKFWVHIATCYVGRIRENNGN